MSHEKLLTITIPTWNRASLLEKLLNELSYQISLYKLENQIEIVISDNCSTDTTEFISKIFVNNFNYINYFRNDRNLGAKHNVIKSLILAQSKYVLLIGDDDRIKNNCLPEILNFLKNHPNSSIIIDTSKTRENKIQTIELSLDKALMDYYWYMGNAGLFISSTKYLKILVEKCNYDFFNECWPQTQLMILSTSVYGGNVYATNLAIPADGHHDSVMVYTSYYLWRTCILELYNAIFSIRHLIQKENYDACRIYMQHNIKQVFFNILQCGVFIDTHSEKINTRNHIWKSISQFSLYEKIFLIIIVIALSLPRSISAIISNLFIFLIKGKKGIQKKNQFVVFEKQKKMKISKTNKIIRMLEFET